MPRTVAVIGASGDRRKFGNKAVRAFHAHGDTVYPINPHETSIEGLTAYPSVLAVPGPIEMATMYVPPHVGQRLLDELSRKQIREVWLNPGSESESLIARARTLGLNVIEACSIMGIGDSPGRY
jgi:acyl-CoA synthetase (NDP forming)